MLKDEEAHRRIDELERALHQGPPPMKDESAHRKIGEVKSMLSQHLVEHSRFEKELADNTTMTRNIARDTGELVTLVRGAKAGRKFIVWVTPILAAGLAGWAWFKDHLR